MLQHQRRHQGGRARAVCNRTVERGFDALVADGEDHVLDGLGEGSKGREAAHAAHRLIARIDREQRAVKSALEQILHDGASDRAGALGCAQHRDRAGTKQGIEPVCHGPSASCGQKSAAGVARRRGGS
jgi:hypothetical protein